MKRRTKKTIAAALAAGSMFSAAGCTDDSDMVTMYGPPPSYSTIYDTPAETIFDADENTAPVLYGPPEYFENAGDNS